MNTPPVIVWFRHDLRLTDHPALHAAVASGRPVIPAYIHSDDGEGDWPLGGATRVGLHHALGALDVSLREAGSQLIIRAGASTHETLSALIYETDASAVYFCDRYEPAVIERDDAIASALRRVGIEVHRYRAGLLYDPAEVYTGQGNPYTVFTPFYRKCLAMPPIRSPLVRPSEADWQSPETWPTTMSVDELGLLPDHPWHESVASHMNCSEADVLGRLDRFLADPVTRYKDERDRTDLDATSGMSTGLRFGLVSPYTVWDRALRARQRHRSSEARGQIDAFLRQLIWREFAYHLLVHFPHTTTEPLRENFAVFPWVDDEAALQRWQRGQTGYPIVDAGMRQLWQTGWMHNRVRMIVASFLCKDLLIHWHHGARWFWDTLFDADLANNTLGWQWTAGCGADAQPFFRIFNPTAQAEKFDPEGVYIRRWVPELAGLSGQMIHEPPALHRPSDYPEPMVDHKRARDEALAAYETVKAKSLA